MRIICVSSAEGRQYDDKLTATAVIAPDRFGFDARAAATMPAMRYSAAITMYVMNSYNSRRITHLFNIIIRSHDDLQTGYTAVFEKCESQTNC